MCLSFHVCLFEQAKNTQWQQGQSLGMSTHG